MPLNRAKFYAAAFVFASLPALSAAQFEEETFKAAGPSVELYYPVSREIRDAFDSQILSLGFGPVDATASRRGRFRTGFNLITAKRSGNKMLLVPLTAIYERDLTSNTTGSRPYLRLGAGVSYYDYSFRANGNKYSNKFLGATGFAELGINLNGRFNFFGRYNAFDKKDGLNFNGWSFGIAYSVLKI
jgi:hypothetical protein